MALATVQRVKANKPAKSIYNVIVAMVTTKSSTNSEALTGMT